MDDSDEVKAARQARLSKALSTAYLTHQITQLEDKVHHVQLNPQTRAFNPAGTGPPRTRQLFDDGGPPPVLRGRGGRGGGGFHSEHRGRGGFEGGRGGSRGRGGPPDGHHRGGRGGGRGGRGRGGGDFHRSSLDHISRDSVPLSSSNGPLILPPSVESNVFPFTKPVMGQTPAVALAEQQRREQAAGIPDRHEERRHGHGREPQRVVVDASAMIWATHQIRRVLKDGGEVIVPVECLRTLDIVKKGMSRVAVAARAATRFIEDAQRKTATPPASSHGGPVVDGIQGLGKALRPGLWIQGDGEVVEIFPANTVPASDATGTEQPPPPVAPQYVKSTLQCALYYRGLWEVPSSSKILAVAHPPANKGSDADGAAEAEDAQITKYRARVDGFEMAEWADKADIGCAVLAAKRGKREKGRPAQEDDATDELELGEEAEGVRQAEHGDARRGKHAHGQPRSERKGAKGSSEQTDRHVNSRQGGRAELPGLAARVDAIMPTVEDADAAEIRALNAAQKARPKPAPAARPPSNIASPTAAQAQPLQLTADALQQSQAAINEMEQNQSPRLARPHVSSAINVRQGSDFVPLKREDARKQQQQPRNEHRAPHSPRQQGRQPAQRRQEAQPEPVQPKMILLQRPKG